MIVEQSGQPLARSGAVTGKNDFLARFPKLGGVGDHRFVDIGILRPLGREIARTLDREVDHLIARRLGEGGGEVNGPFGGLRAPFLLRQIERRGRQGPIAARIGHHRPGAVGEIILDRLRAAGQGAVGAAVAQDDIRLAEMIEQGRQFLLEQGQPMLHPRQPPPVADRLIQRIAGGIGAEFLAIGGAEALDAVGVEQRLAGRHQREGGRLAGRFLVGRVEVAHGLDFVAEEIEPDRLGRARRIEVDDRPAHRIFARIMDRIGALIAIGMEQGGKLVALDRHPFGQLMRELADAERGQHALGRGIGGGDQHLRTGQRLLQRMERRHPLGHNPQRRAGAVVGQAIPRREADHLDLGREGGDGIGQRAHRGFVGGNDDQAAALARAMRRAREVGREPRQEAGRHRGERQRLACTKDRLQRVTHRAIRMKSSLRNASIIGPSKRGGHGQGADPPRHDVDILLVEQID